MISKKTSAKAKGPTAKSSAKSTQSARPTKKRSAENVSKVVTSSPKKRLTVHIGPNVKKLISPVKAAPKKAASGRRQSALPPPVTDVEALTHQLFEKLRTEGWQPAAAAIAPEVSQSMPETVVATTLESPAVPAPVLPQATFAQAFGLAVNQELQSDNWSLAALQGKEARVVNAMDPRLQLLVSLRQKGQPRAATAAASGDEVPVIAVVTDVAAWEGLSEVRLGTQIGKIAEGQFLVTGRLPVRRVEAVLKQPFVESLKAAHPLRPTLAATIQETHARADLLPAGTKPQGGKGIVVGIVDFGCDFAHRNFINANGTTRLEAIWDQSAPEDPAAAGVAYGRVYRPEQINAALKTASPYTTLGYGPVTDSTGTHGTHVMDIAAGNGRGSGVPGCAPEASLIFVDLNANDYPVNGPEMVYKSFGDSVRLLEALKFIFTEAGDRPCVINLSLGTNGGPHDGSSSVERGIDALIREKPNRAVVIAASNSHDDGIHAAGTVPEGGTYDLVWVPMVEDAPAEMDIWLTGTAQAAVELVAADGTSVTIVEPGKTWSFDNGTQPIIFIANRLADPNNKDNCIGIYLAEFDTGNLTVRLHARGTGEVPFHAWIERADSQSQSSFDGPQRDNSHTLGSISTGHETLVVGSYDAHKASLPISWFSSEGPTRDGRLKPELSAPGHEVAAAKSGTLTQVVRKSGTSMAAPTVTGIVALLYAEAVRKNRSLDSAALRKLLIANAKSNPPAAGSWNSLYGNGRISADVLAAV